MRPSSALLLPWMLCAAVAATGLIFAAEPPQLPTFEDEAQVLVVEVPVHVTGANSQAVRGLTAADFELFDNGERQTIKGLEVVDLEEVSASLPADGHPPAELAASSRRHLLLLFDLAFTPPAAIARARAAARQFVLEALHPTDLAAVAVFTLETGPRLVVTFTPDRAQLARALDELSARPAYQAFDRDPLRFLLGSALEQPAESLTGSVTSGGGAASEEALENLTVMRKQMEVSQKAYERGRISAWTRGLSEMARWLRTVEGRKQVVFFSEGIDTRLMLGREPDLQSPEMAADQFNLRFGNLWMVDSDDLFGNVGVQNDVARMVEEFRRADCMIQAVDVSGLQARGEIVRSSGAAGGNGRESLFYVARETGGELFANDNDLRRGLNRILSRSAVTYVLSFQPPRLAWDGAYHRLKVSLRREAAPGASLAYRTGYHAPRPFPELDSQEKALLASEAIAAAVPKNDLKVDVLAAPFSGGAGAAYVPVIVEVGGDELLVGQKGERLGVEIYAYVTNEKGEMKDFFAQVVGLDLKRGKDALATGGLKYYGHLDLNPGRFLIRVLVRNGETGRTGVVTLPLSVPELSDSSALLPPFFFDTPGRWLLIREAQTGGLQESVVYPFTANGEPYVPAVRPTLRSDQTTRLCLVAYNLGAMEFEVKGSVVDTAGREAEGGELLAIERTVTGISGLDKFVATFDPSGLAAGDYTLQVALVDRSTGTRMNAAAPFTVIQ